MLGTANLGLSYGATNPQNFDKFLSKKILEAAISRGISKFDTAPDYGIAEELLGQTLGGQEFTITTKISSTTEIETRAVILNLRQSLKRLNRENVNCVLFHNPEAYKAREFKKVVTNLKESGLTRNVGISVYSATDILRSLETTDEITTYQVPENILDRRLINNKDLLDLHNQGKRFTVRSIFLQGTILAKCNELPHYLQKHSDIFLKLHSEAVSLGVPVVDLCLSYAFNIEWASEILISAASLAQLNRILESNVKNFDFEVMARLPENALDPRKWT